VQRLILSVLLLAAALDESEWKDHEHANPQVVKYVLASPDRTWNFMVAPDSRYAERRAIAMSAGKVLDWSWLRRIDAVREDLTLQYGTYAPESPKYSSGGPLGSPADPGKHVTIAGHVWTVPAERVPYPSTFEQRSHAPWPWQASLALRDAWRSIFFQGKMDTFLPFVASLPCESEADAIFFRKVSVEMANVRRERMPIEIIGAWRNLLLRDRAVGNTLSPYMNTWALRFDDRNAWLYAHVILLDRIDAGDIYGASFHLYELRERIDEVPGRDLPGAIPYTAVLAIARHAIFDESLTGYVRVMAGLGVARALGGSYLPSDDRLRPSAEADEPEMMRRFAEWFAPREASVAVAAAAERETLDDARKTLASVRKCARGVEMRSY
jgi:hypothetical protein